MTPCRRRVSNALAALRLFCWHVTRRLPYGILYANGEKILYFNGGDSNISFAGTQTAGGYGDGSACRSRHLPRGAVATATRRVCHYSFSPAIFFLLSNSRLRLHSSPHNLFSTFFHGAGRNPAATTVSHRHLAGIRVTRTNCHACT